MVIFIVYQKKVGSKFVRNQWGNRLDHIHILLFSSWFYSDLCPGSALSQTSCNNGVSRIYASLKLHFGSHLLRCLHVCFMSGIFIDITLRITSSCFSFIHFHIFTKNNSLLLPLFLSLILYFICYKFINKSNLIIYKLKSYELKIMKNLLINFLSHRRSNVFMTLVIAIL